MTDYEFWHKDPNLLVVFHKEYYRRLHDESHIQGFYNYSALMTALGNFGLKFQKTKQVPYMEKPEDPFKEKLTEKQIDDKYRKTLNYQVSWINALSNNK